jgi:hypothetical protein
MPKQRWPNGTSGKKPAGLAASRLLVGTRREDRCGVYCGTPSWGIALSSSPVALLYECIMWWYIAFFVACLVVYLAAVAWTESWIHRQYPDDP